MNYDDIIDLPHYHADGRPYMSMRDRAAQFAPFKNLKGFDELVDEEEFDIEKGANALWYDIEPGLDEFFEEEIYYS